MSWSPRTIALAAAIAMSVVGGHARADAPAPTSEARKEAARKFEDGTRAFDAGDFTRAGESFEAAYILAPHEDPLWNAARAWHKAGEVAHAATLYARYLREAPPNARDRASATASLAQISPRLAQIELHLGAGVDDPRVDGARIDGPIVFVAPGTHELRARGPHGDIESRKSVDAGTRVSVVLADDTPASIPPPASSPPPAIIPPPRSGWSPLVVAVEGGVTLVLTGLAIWSGLDTLDTLHSFDAAPTGQKLEDGRSQEIRTNVLIGAAIGGAAITTITALFLTDWGSRERAITVGVGPGTATVGGTF